MGDEASRAFVEQLDELTALRRWPIPDSATDKIDQVHRVINAANAGGSLKVRGTGQATELGVQPRPSLCDRTSRFLASILAAAIFGSG